MATSPDAEAAAPSAQELRGPSRGVTSRSEPGPSTPLRLGVETLPVLTGVAIAAVGSVVLVGWAAGIEALQSLGPGTITMKVNTAVCFVLLGAAVAVSAWPFAGDRARAVGRALSFAVVALAAVVGSQYVTGANYGIDELLFRDAPNAVGTVHAGRMSPQTAVAFIALGSAALLATAGTGYRVVVGLVLATLLLAAVNLMDLVLGASIPSFLAAYTQMALPTAASFVVAAIGVVALLPRGGPLSLLEGTGPVARLGRRLLAAAVVIPTVAGWLRLQGERAGLYDSAFGVSILTTFTIALLIVAMWRALRAQERADVERRAAEEESRQARQVAEQANRAKSEFLSRMSHELRTPLNAVLGFGQLLQMDELTPAQRESADHIVKAGRHLLALIDDVLDISRIEAGTIPISSEPVPVEETLSEVVAFVEPTAAERRIGIERQPSSGAEPHVWADRQRLKQVLLNLVSNAVKYNNDGGTVTIGWQRVAGDRLRIHVDDTGPGLAPDQLGRLFTPFERLGAEHTGVEGTGIGLALSKRLVEQMGGEIGVESEDGKGSRFWVDLDVVEGPIERFERTSAEVEAPPRGTPRQVSILYLEDNLSNLRLVERILARRPEIRLESAMQGRRGLELATRMRPDLILLDLHLPDIPGAAVLRELRAVPETRSIPVVVLTADATESQVDRLLAAGASGYLKKPIDVQGFLAVLDKVLA